ncbi:MAG: 30S ribosomal protein S17 [Candidatus Zixiibacteriota bacterium]|nr:MAG: 30S ribosomal protein S17 [candidate division Zixibacteria bacterium]
MTTTTQRRPRKTKVGTVVSNKMQKTITVAVERRVAHPLYGKYFKRTERFMAHDADSQANLGDTVRIMECRPLSRHKTWRLVEVVERAK